MIERLELVFPKIYTLLIASQSMFTTLIQGVGVFLLTQFVIRQFSGASQSSTPDVATSPAAVGSFEERPELSTIANYSDIPFSLAPIWPDDCVLDVRVYVTTTMLGPHLKTRPAETLVLEANNFKMGNFSDSRAISTTIKIPSEVQRNATLWAHIYAGLSGTELDPLSPRYDVGKAVHFYKPLNHYIPKKKVRKLKNLLDKTETEEEEVEEPQAVQIGSYYHPNHTLALVPATGLQNWRSMHPALRADILMEPTGARDASGRNGWYYPVFFLNKFWQLRSQMMELNSTVTEVPLNLNLYQLAGWKYTLLATIDEGMRQNSIQAASGGPMPAGGDGSEFEKFKEILLDTNSYLLGTTFIVSILHMIFEGLAFKNDISHWRKKKDNVGTSVRTIIANVFMQTIIFLYLVDNSDGTSWMILAGQGFGILLEAWKITKTSDVRIRDSTPGSTLHKLGIPYTIVFEDKHKLSDVEKKTQEYDQIAFKYLYIVAVPLLLAYAAYSLVYETHKSWYSFVIETLVGSVYAYGFLMMVPSLYINYRLKSVAHMPSKAMTYKFLNTFIDDLFAFTIRMPTLHRLATLRDDVIFFIWLYQKYMYKVDHTRVNEFGQGGESDDEGETETTAKKEEALAGQDTKELKPTAPIASASGTEKQAGAKKRK